MKTLLIKNPRITEKAAALGASNAYTFDITKDANKTEIKKAIFEMYKVRPVRVNIVNISSKTIFSRGRKGMKPGVKKAVVYLKKGDEIKFV